MAGFGKKQPPELVPEHVECDGASLFRFTFNRDARDLSHEFHQLTVEVLARMDYDHITISCPDGPPAWLTAYFRSLRAYGLPVEVTPAPTGRELLDAIATAKRRTRFSWPAGAVPFVVECDEPPADGL